MLNRPYQPNYEWIWAGLPETTVVVLRLTVTHPDASVLGRTISKYLAGLYRDEFGVHGCGGWAVYPNAALSSPHRCVLDLVSGGEDAADSLIDGADRTFSQLTQTPGIHLYWTELPSLLTPDFLPR